MLSSHSPSLCTPFNIRYLRVLKVSNKNNIRCRYKIKIERRIKLRLTLKMVESIYVYLYYVIDWKKNCVTHNQWLIVLFQIEPATTLTSRETFWQSVQTAKSQFIIATAKVPSNRSDILYASQKMSFFFSRNLARADRSEENEESGGRL